MGSAAGWRADLEVPARHGMRQTVGDSVGPGGVLRALRHVPELVAIARDVAELAPAAWLVNYSNPLTANVRAITDAPPVNAFGLCHGTMHTRAALAADLGVARDELHAVFAGLNHLCWLLDVRHGSTDLYPRLRRAGRASAPAARTRPPTPREGVHLAVSADLLRDVRPLPGAGRPPRERVLRRLPPRRRRRPARWGLQGGHDMTLRVHRREGRPVGPAARAGRRNRAAGRGRNQEAERLVAIAEALRHR